ncbi:MAG: halocyanin domain-containing protein [Halodesulfurarchaeum sp.]
MSRANTMTRRRLLTTAAGTAATAAVPAAAAQTAVDYGGWFDGVSNFTGTVDYTGRKSVTVKVGAKANNGYYGFSPPAIRVDPGTTVTWEWTGKGGAHNVVAKNGTFKSNLMTEDGATFSYTFEGSGGGPTVHKYYCSPHRPMGMRGAVVVGGSGGIPPSEFEKFSVGGGGQTGGQANQGTKGSGTGGDQAAPAPTGGGLTVGTASIALGGIAALVSPIFFGTFYLCCKDSDGGDGGPE